jgi:hypothetical protein
MGFSDARMRVTLARFLELKQALEQSEIDASLLADEAKVVQRAEADEKQGRLVRARLRATLKQAAKSDPTSRFKVVRSTVAKAQGIAPSRVG